MDYKLDFENKVVLITGGAGGIGVECARGFLQNGASVMLADLRVENLEKVKEKLCNEFESKKVATVTADVTKKEDCEKILEAVESNFSRLDVLVNNVGVAHDVYSCFETREAWDGLLEINLSSQFFLTQAVFNRFFKNQKSGKVVFMSSLSAYIAVPSAAAYSASKGAVLQLTKALAGEWARFGVEVNCVCPGFVETPLIEKQMNDPNWMGYMNIRIPKRRLAKAQDVVGSVLFLSSALSDYVTGTSVIVDGGYHACG